GPGRTGASAAAGEDIDLGPSGTSPSRVLPPAGAKVPKPSSRCGVTRPSGSGRFGRSGRAATGDGWDESGSRPMGAGNDYRRPVQRLTRQRVVRWVIVRPPAGDREGRPGHLGAAPAAGRPGGAARAAARGGGAYRSAFSLSPTRFTFSPSP